MSMTRLRWADLPPEVRRAVVDQTGEVHEAASASAGINSAVAAVLDTETGRVFVKGIPHEHSQVRTQQREASINPYIAGLAPRLLWVIDAADGASSATNTCPVDTPTTLPALPTFGWSPMPSGDCTAPPAPTYRSSGSTTDSPSSPATASTTRS